MSSGRTFVLFALALALTGCGGGAPSGAADGVVTTAATDATTTVPDDTTTAQQQRTTTTAKRQYGWFLPAGPTSPTTNEDVLYQRLLRKACGEAQSELDRTWNGLLTPRNAPLYQAAVDLCAGDASGARAMLARATALGLEVHRGPGGSAACDCALLKAVRSVVEQVAQESVRCTPGTPPRWPADDPFERDDPRTDEVEGTTSAATTTTATTTTGSAAPSS